MSFGFSVGDFNIVILLKVLSENRPDYTTNPKALIENPATSSTQLRSQLPQSESNSGTADAGADTAIPSSSSQPSPPLPSEQPSNSQQTFWQRILSHILPAETIVGNALALLAVAAAFVALQIALWTTTKEFREVCENDQVRYNTYPPLSWIILHMTNWTWTNIGCQ